MEEINWWPLDKEEQEWNKGSEDLEFVELIPQIPEEVRHGTYFRFDNDYNNSVCRF
jgi:hypothetical protein